MCVPNTDVKKKSLKSNIHNIIRRWKLILRRISEEALNNLDENDISMSDDRRIEALFNVNNSDNSNDNSDKRKNKKKGKDSQSLNDGEPSNSNKYIDISKQSISTPLRIEGNDDKRRTTDLNINSYNTEDSGYNNDGDGGVDIDVGVDTHKITFDNYDSVKECEKLRSEINGTFYHAEIIWETRRKLWTENITNTDPSKEHNRDIFKSIPEQYYYRVYKKLVIDDKPLREPLNLEDAIKVINSGWMETKPWDNASKV